MRLLFVSNAPWAPTGYGNQTKHILRWLRDQGHDVAALCFWGLQGGRIEWEGIPCFPRHLALAGQDVTRYYARQHRADAIITLYDVWPLDPAISGAAPWVAMVPIDHETVPAMVLNNLQHATMTVPYSRYGERLLLEAGVSAQKLFYAPHGVPCEVFRPLPIQTIPEIRKRVFSPDDTEHFWIGMVAANKGWPSRKGFPEVFQAFAVFHQRHPDSRLYIHTSWDTRFQGPDLNQMRMRPYGIPDGAIYFAEPTMYMDGYPEELMVEIYNAFDVFVNPAYGEGFGIPIIEAQACGVPVIVGDNTAMTELVGPGWLVPPSKRVPSGGLGANWYLPDPGAILNGFEAAYDEWMNAPKRWAARKAKAREFILKEYDYRLVLERYWKPLMRRLDHLVGGDLLWDIREAVREEQLAKLEPQAPIGATALPRTEIGGML